VLFTDPNDTSIFRADHIHLAAGGNTLLANNVASVVSPWAAKTKQ
jgi:hypothetical protein